MISVDIIYRQTLDNSDIIVTMNDLRVPPNSVEAERAVLGCIFLDSIGRSEDRVLDECRSQGVVAETFYNPANRIIYTVILEMIWKKKVMNKVIILPRDFQKRS